MAIISFGWTKRIFLKGLKTCTRRDWSRRQREQWIKWYRQGKRIHQAYDKDPRYGGKCIGFIYLTHEPYVERLCDMHPLDLVAEGGLWKTIEQFCTFIKKPPNAEMTVIRFKKISTKWNI